MGTAGKTTEVAATEEAGIAPAASETLRRARRTLGPARRVRATRSYRYRQAAVTAQNVEIRVWRWSGVWREPGNRGRHREADWPIRRLEPQPLPELRARRRRGL